MPEPEIEKLQPVRQPDNLLDLEPNQPRQVPANTGGASLLDMDSDPTPSRMYQTSMQQ